MRRGCSFRDAEVAECYVYRPDYPKPIFDKLLEVSPGRNGLLDLGCGTGKITRRLAPHFASVTGGITPSCGGFEVGSALQGRSMCCRTR